MQFVIDHDLHIHSQLSSCSKDPAMTSERILEYAKEKGLRRIALTNHLWDSAVAGASDWYQPQDIAHICGALPLPKAEGIEFLFGCEAELREDLTLGLARENMDKFDFIIIPTTHMHMEGFTVKHGATIAERAEAYVKRLDAVLHMDLPFHKVGLAHLTCRHIARGEWRDHISVLNLVSDEDFKRLFARAAELGVGIELNIPIRGYEGEDRESILRPYRIAKSEGCKFYLGGDAHRASDLAIVYDRFAIITAALALEESDKFIPGI